MIRSVSVYVFQFILIIAPLWKSGAILDSVIPSFHEHFISAQYDILEQIDRI